MLRPVNFFSKITDSFSARLLVSVTSLILCLTAAASFFFYKNEKAQITTSIVKHGHTISKLLAHNIRIGVFSGDQQTLLDPVQAVAREQDILEILVFNQDTSLLLALQADTVTGPQSSELERDAMAIRFIPTLNRESIHEEEKDKFIFGAPVLIEPEFSSGDLFLDYIPEESEEKSAEEALQQIGYVVVLISKAGMSRDIRKLLTETISFSILLALLSCGAIHLAIKGATKSLASLTSEIKRYSEGKSQNPDREVIPADFNEMVMTLRDAFTTIAELKEGLELKVEERTREIAGQKEDLEVTNKKLTAAMDELQATQTKLIQSEKMAALGQMISGLTHEINNSINFVSGSLPVLEKNIRGFRKIVGRLTPAPGEDGAKSQSDIILPEENLAKMCNLGQLDKVLDNIRQGVQRTTRVIHDLRNVSHSSERGFEPADINATLESTIGLVQHEYKHGIEIVRQYDRKLPSIMCQVDRLNQVFLNIMLNAIQAMNGTGCLTVSSSADEQNIVVSIRDTGPGIPDEVRGNIFDPFFTTKEIGKGTGLGLSISYNIVKEHQGEIVLNSSQGQGAEFRIILPRHTKT